MRSLHAGGVPTTVVMLDPWEPVRASRFAEKILVPQRGGAGEAGGRDIESAVLEVLSRIDRDPRPVLIPTSDLLAHIVAKHRATLERRFRCCIPPAAAMEIVLDKAKDTRALEGTGVPLPNTAQDLPSSPAELVRRIGLPLIVKPRTYVDKDSLGWRNVVIRSLADAEQFYRTSQAVFHRVVAQELIPGPDDALWECICLFNDRSELVRAFTFRKLATMPAHFGATSRARSERSETLVRLAAEAGKAFGYVGIADVDVKYDARDGRFKYLELNPRLGLAHWFGTRCGVNITLDAYRLQCGEDLSPGNAQVEGKPYLAVLEETGARLQDGDSVFAIAGGILAALLGRPVGPYFAWNDMLPGPFTVMRIARRLMNKSWRLKLRGEFTKEYK